MKKTAKKLVSFMLVLLMAFSTVTPGLVFAEGEMTQTPEYKTQMNFTAAGAPVADAEPSKLLSLCKGATYALAGRAINEMVSLVISSDIPGLTSLVIMLQDPATRAELKHKELVSKMANSVAEIRESVARIEEQLNEISDKIDKYATAEKLMVAIQNLNSIASKYQAAWENYEAVRVKGKELVDLESEHPEATRTEEQKTKIDGLAQELSNLTNTFINGIREGEGFPFLTDLQIIPGYIWNSTGAAYDYDASYLGAYEAYLRERYTFEHQITDALAQAVESCVDLQTQMLILYSAYYSYLASTDKDNPDYATYTDEYFQNIQYNIVKNIDAMVESTGFGKYMIADKLTEAELAEIHKYDPDYVEPENINSTVTVDGKSYDAYKVRSNASLDYYFIFKNTVGAKDVVKAYNVSEAGDGYPYQIIYRPELVHNGLYTDDGKYRMVSDVSELDFVSSQANLLSMLRDVNGCNLSEISQTTSHVLLYGYDYKGNGNQKSSKTWNVKLQSITDIKSEASTVTAQNYYDSGTQQSIVIYKDMLNERDFVKNGTYTINDKGFLEGKTIVVTDGHTLDISAIGLDVSNVKIFVSGSGTVISNPDITLKDSFVVVADTSEGDNVYFKNLNVVSGENDEAALTVKSPCTVNFEGSNSFAAVNQSGSDSSRASEIHKKYTRTRPIFASHGVLIEDNTVLKGADESSLTAKGSYGGAGICLDKGNLTINNLTVKAEGSAYYCSNNSAVATVGAGIGSCVTFTITYHGSTGIFGSSYYYVNGSRPKISKGDSTINKSGTLNIINSDITATAKTFSYESYSELVNTEDIGGVKLGDGYYCLKDGSFSESTINATSAKISDRIATKGNNNIYKNEIFAVLAYTKGSNGVTTDGISFKLHGKNDTDQWIAANSIGNDKGNNAQTVTASSVNGITFVEVKTNSGNHWFPGKINISGKYSGDSVTVYGGRWIGSSGTTLKTTDNIYKVTVNTGKDDYAGTDSEIFLYLQDEKGVKTENLDLSDIHQDGNAFEKGDSETFWIYAPDNFGECRHAFFYSDHSNSSAGWQLGSFTVEKVQGKSADSGYSFTSGQWFEEARRINFGKYSGKTGAFYIEVKTQDSSGAGTDSNIYLTIYGDKGNTGEINLGTYAGSSDNFEKGDLDCFYIGYNKNAIGTINKIEIRKDDSGSNPDWKVEYIKITEEVAEGVEAQSVTFSLNQKLGDSTYTFDSSHITGNLRQSKPVINRDILRSLEQNEDGTYTLTVDRNITLEEEVFDLLIEKGAVLTVKMMGDDGKMIYSITFDGKRIKYYHSLELKKGYSFADGYAMLDFISRAKLPEGTRIAVDTGMFDISESEEYDILAKNENGEWVKQMTVTSDSGVIEFEVVEGREILISKQGQPLPSEGEEDSECEICGQTHENIIDMLICFLVKLLSDLFKVFGNC